MRRAFYRNSAGSWPGVNRVVVETETAVSETGTETVPETKQEQKEQWE